MENLGYKEGSALPKHRRVSRAVSLAVDKDASPLNVKPRFKTFQPSMMVRWKNDPEAILEEQYPGEGFEYIEVGPSPQAENAPSMYDSFEERSAELGVQICSDTIRMNLLEQMKISNGSVKLLEDIEKGNIIADNVEKTFANCTEIEKNIGFLWSAYLKRWDLLEGLLKAGAKLDYCDPNGISALHLSSFSGCLNCTNFLITKKMDVNLLVKCYTPLHCAAFGNSPETAKMLINNNAKMLTNTNKENCQESLLHCAVRANSLECVKLFVSEGADVNSLKPNGTNPIHLAADLGHTECLKALLDAPTADPNIKICIREKESTALHLAADEGNIECVNLLLAKGANAKQKNHRGFTALHLAARTSSLECVESLLQAGGADPNAQDFDKRTPLHASVGKSDSAYDIAETLIAWGANVNEKDIFGFTALHLAALEGLAQLVEMLLFHGADVTTKSNKGSTALNVIHRKTPASLKMITQKLDTAITLHHAHESTNREVELELDFRQILQHYHPREINYLNTFVDEGQKEFLQHPLCAAFLYIKWAKIRKYFIARIILKFMFVLCLSLYVLTTLAHTCYSGGKVMDTIQEQELCQKQSILGDLLRNNPFVMATQWRVLLAMTIFEILRKLYGITGYSSVKTYFTQVENIIEWLMIISVFAISNIYTNSTYVWQNHVGAFTVLLGWTNLMFMVGQFPIFGVYVTMYSKVQGEFAKLFAAYACMLVGFTISFCVIYPQSSSFANPFMGFITVLTMMIGELDLSILVNDPDGKDPPFLLEVSAQITFVLFLMFVTIILMNLLIGIAVHDINGLKKTAGLSKLVSQTKLISYIESALFNCYLPNCIRQMLHNTALVSPQAYRVVLSVKPLNPGEKRLPRDILMAAYEVAKERRQYGHTISSRNSSATTNNTYKTKLFENNNGGESEYGFDTASIEYTNLTTKIDESSEQIMNLSNEVRELKTALTQNYKIIDQLLLVIANQTHVKQ